MRRSLFLAVLLCLPATTLPDVLVPLNSSWNYMKGTAAPPSAWRERTFDDSGWTGSPSPFYYGEALSGGTLMSDMRNSYTTVYFRQRFNVPDAAAVSRMALRVLVDDGYIVWINGSEVARFNVTAAEPAFNGRAAAAIEPTWVTNSLAAPSGYLVNGENVIAVQLLNASPTSSDIVFNLQLESTSDTVPPTISGITPAPGRVTELTSIEVTFSEPVQGVKAQDLLLNNQPAETVSGAGAAYTFSFTSPPLGPVDVTWEPGHQITDFADPPHSFDSENAGFSYLFIDETVPYLLSVVPPADTTVRQLSSVELQFSEEVTHIEAGDLLLNGSPATNLLVRPGNTYVFQFPAQAPGLAQLTWANAHGITDLATNAFTANSWSYTVDPTLPVSQVVISEFLAGAEDAAGLKDEDGELQDWIELYNSGGTAVNLAGWSLTDDPDEPGLWTFPSVSLPAGGRLVVFASAKDRKPVTPGAPLHTNFKLNGAGEYLALFNADSPRAALTEFRNDYPEQRNDYSYGVDPNGLWRYYQTPTPGQANGSSSITGVVPKPTVDHKRGWYDAPFSLAISNALPGVTIRYTTDGTVPTENNGSTYTGPLNVSSNLVLRAAAFRANSLPSQAITHTYLFPEKILSQVNNPAGFPSTWGTTSGFPNNLIPADYEMDPEVVNDPAYAPEMVAALKALPIISIAMKTDDMFGAANGIYTHTLSRGPQWERPCSIEFIPLSGGDFQEDAGIQIQGNAAREPLKQPKHPLRVTFKGDYGAKKLDYKMFPDSPVSSFDTIVLRADFNYSWLHWNPTQRVRSQRIRDAWMKDSMRAMGGLACHNRYVHLFINGLYWGVYDPTERPDGSFGEAYFGGDKEDYDVINEGAVVDGTAGAYNALLGFSDLSTPDQYAAIKQYLDMPQFIDYMLLHFYVGHEDWGKNKNWYMIRPRDGSLGFFYLPWDGEMILGDTTINRVTNPDVPSDLHTKLVANAQYRLDFADRVQRHFFENGALTPAQNIARWQARTSEIELPIIAESARWGDYRRDVHQYQSPPYEFYTRDVQWRAEQNRLLNSYFPTRTATVLNQLKAVGLYPSVAAPVFNQYGGHVAAGYQLQMAGPGTIYYTTDGSDPRTYNTGEIAPQARIYTVPVVLSSDVRIKARVYSGGTWSALTEAAFTTGGPRVPLRITEIMYNPDPAGDAFEFIELQNVGSLPFDASGYYLEGVNYIFPPRSVIEPDQIIVLGSSENPTTFGQRYPGLSVFGRFGGQLLNRGERLALMAPDRRTAQSVDFNDKDGWPAAADGHGPSLEILDPLGDPDDPANWVASAANGGSPGRANGARAVSPLRINEVRANTPDDSDWIELFASEPVNIGGWKLSEANSTNSYTFPAAALNAGSYYTVAMRGAIGSHDFQAPFALDLDGETIILSDALGNVRDIFTFGPQAAALSAGLLSDRIVLAEPTPGAPNQPAAVGAANLRLNEMLANPAPGGSDWIEIYNPDAQRPASLQGLFIAVSNQVFEITSASFIAPGGFVRLFADEQPGPNHLDFKVPASGGKIELLDPSGAVLDQLAYGAQSEGISFGRYPDGASTLASFGYPTPKRPNSLGFPIEITSQEAGSLVLSWPSRAGQRYRIESSDSLPAWGLLGEISAQSSQSSVTNSMSGARRYFRVVELPAQ